MVTTATRTTFVEEMHSSVSYMILKFRKAKHTNLKWTPRETLFRDRWKHVNPFFIGRQVPFQLVNQVKFRRSLLGTFLEEFNYQQNQTRDWNEVKLGLLMFNWDSYDAAKLALIESDNYFAENLMELLKSAIKEKEMLDFDVLFEHITALRYCDLPLTYLDQELGKFRNLKVLILCGNWLSEICGKCLPRCLKYLELFANRIDDVKSFTVRAPKQIFHLGLQRNCISMDSQLHLLNKGGRFKYLRSLDLAENEICELTKVLNCLNKLTSLLSLQLQGNPCSVINFYKDEVLRFLPDLLYLDNTQILESDRVINEAADFDAAIIFTCHRIIGIPPPPKEKGVTHNFHFEVTMPLLEEVIIEEEEPEIPPTTPEENAERPNSSKNSKRDKSGSRGSKKSSKKGSKKSKSSKNSKKASPYSAPDEYFDEIKKRVKNYSFKTERFPYAKIMQLPEDALIVPPFYKSLLDIRDTFRSSVNVKLIYQKILPPQKGKKDKKKGKKDKKGKKAKGKGKGKKGKDKKSSKSSKSSEGVENKPVEPVVVEEPKETILKKITMANFWCDLHSINWSDKTIDFYWAEHPKSMPNAIEVEGSLRALDYMHAGKGIKKKKEKKAKKPKKEKKAKGKKGASSEGATTADVIKPEAEVIEFIKPYMPNILTCQVGFGLLRSYPQD